ncbi:MAG: NPCBM/NEW2 domain-containing protein [Candidatus Zipacnadales bacterium]
MDLIDIPTQEVTDEVMAEEAEVAQFHAWALAAFLGEKPPGIPPRVELQVRRQDYNILRFGESCMETPITIGQRTFAHGLGTHANSEIAVTLPPGARKFTALVGIDNNYDTQGHRGSVQFSAEVDGQEAFHTDTLRGGQEPVLVSIDLPEKARELVLRVDTTADGPAYDQADWADAQLLMADGSVRYLDENHTVFLVAADQPPFSFTYGAQPSRALLSQWTRTSEVRNLSDATERRVTWTDEETGLTLTAVLRLFSQYPAVDWVLYFENTGTADTPLLQEVHALDIRLSTGNSQRTAVLHGLNGDLCGEQSFVPFERPLAVGESFHMAPTGGRPSNGAFPFFNMQYRDEGLVVGLGWSGQWAADFERLPAGPLQVRAGMELTHLKLHPSERLRSPRVLLMGWKGDRWTAQNRFRRLLLFHYVPRWEGRPVRLPVVSQCFDRYSWTRPDWATEAGQIAAVEFAKQAGFDSHWLDAAWFVGGFPHGVGNWYPKPTEFPNGLRPIAQACHKDGLKFVLWFEPERVAADTQIAREHPEFVFGGKNGGLFKLNDPTARRWLTDLLSQRITEYGIDVYRNDFNIDPLPFWRENDEPDRQGITEIRYVEGHYEMWDELRARHPALLIDNCASGGRRIDLETIARSVPLWRSDTSCSPGHPEWNQAQTVGLSQYIPLHTACGWTPEPYDFRSSATGGAIAQWAYLDPDFPRELAKATLAEAKANQKYWYGDFYPLTGCSVRLTDWIAYQLHRPDLNEGLVLAFRRAESNYTGLEVKLRGLNKQQTYRLEFIDEVRKTLHREVTGSELMSGWELRIPRGTSLVIRYAAQ